MGYKVTENGWYSSFHTFSDYLSFLSYGVTNYQLWFLIYRFLHKWLVVDGLNFLLIWIRNILVGLFGRHSYVSFDLCQ
jgi:hypothetical protein